ncbi:MAG: VOC family protein [Bacteroidetes bacterium]|nr:VOC family protein [Bacteroidota bacterium]
MKKKIVCFIMCIVFLFLLISPGLKAQVDIDKLSIKPYLVAIVVSDAKKTINWYEQNLGFKTFKVFELPEFRGKVYFIKRGDFQIEVIENDKSLPKQEMTLPEGIEFLQGYLKLAFFTDDLDGLTKQLKYNKVYILIDITKDPLSEFRFILIEDNEGNTIQIYGT